ncbi:MAG: aerobic carbon-monoxide dehydrogenase large subunit [Thermoleophilaceae bacterium]|jgi:carbon-monoxide dehydrogenase large subunit|nr:aerobic carbon-monoxide dehydrogenase large subunit [Thermoleophilaceae bacterium]
MEHSLIDPSLGEAWRPRVIGVRSTRREDDAILRGEGQYVADVRLPRMVEACFVRSQLAHARLLGVPLEEARAADGVVAAYAADDLDGVAAVPDLHKGGRPVATYPLARDRVRYVGAPIAVVVAADRYAAEDAAELVVPDLEPLPVVAGMDEALAPGAELLYPDWPDNMLIDAPASNPDVAEAFAGLRSVGGSYTIQRVGGVPMETRGVVADYRNGRLTVWTSTQYPHIVRTMLHYVLGLPEGQIRVIAPDVGGGFGTKAQIYVEEYIIASLALRLRRPVRWIEDRYEHLVTAAQARDVRFQLEAAVRDDGSIQALRGQILHDLGSGEMYPPGFNPSFVAVGMLTGAYRIPHQQIGVRCVVTNKTPAGAYRGFGMPECTFALERLIDKIGGELGIDPLDVRRRMLLDPGEMPYVTASGARLDSGSHREAFERAVSEGERLTERARARWADNPDVRIGMGVATYTEGTAANYFFTSGHWTNQDSCDVRFDPDGGVTVGVGVSTTGQGLHTMVATVAAEALGVPIDNVRVVMGDTDTSPHGLGGFASRSTVVAAGAIHKAAGEVREKGARIAAHLLEAAPEDLELVEGGFHVRGTPHRGVSWGDVARAALVRTVDLPPDVEPGLEAKAVFVPPGVAHAVGEDGRLNACPTYANATHVAVVKVDVRTGIVAVVDYVAVHDCGRVINPLIVAGQVHGGVAQGIGGALYEDFGYDDLAQPQSTSFMAYLIPTASEIPPIHAEEMESPAPEIPFGVKGVGEGGIIGPPAAIAGAVEAALAEFDPPELTATPITPQDVHAIVTAAGRAS